MSRASFLGSRPRFLEFLAPWNRLRSLESTSLVADDLVRCCRPYFLQHFRNLEFWKSATPIDYDTLINDVWFQNMVDYRLAALRGNQLDSYALTITAIRKVLELLDGEPAL